MNGIEKITARIAADAQAESDALAAQTKEKVQAIQSEYAEKARQEREAILARGKKAAGERLERLESATGMERRKLELATKQEMLGEAFDRALEKLCSLPEAEYTSLLSSLAIKAARTGQEQMIFSQADRARVGKQVVMAANEQLAAKGLPGELKLSGETRAIKAGFILSDGDVEINCAFDTLVRMHREELEKDVVQILFH